MHSGDDESEKQIPRGARDDVILRSVLCDEGSAVHSVYDSISGRQLRDATVAFIHLPELQPIIKAIPLVHKEK